MIWRRIERIDDLGPATSNIGSFVRRAARGGDIRQRFTQEEDQ
jgi:hypothetical protein